MNPSQAGRSRGHETLIKYSIAAGHPAAIISHSLPVERKPVVEVLLCATLRGDARPAGHEVLLNSADGLDWKTLCRCDLLWLVEKAKLHQRRGVVTRVRRRQIVDKINAAMGWKLA